MKKKIFSNMRKKLIVYSIILAMLILNFAFVNNVEATAEEGKFTKEECPYDITFVTMASGENQSFAIDDSGNLWAWGSNLYCTLGDGKTGTSYTPIKIYTETKFQKICSVGGTTLAIDENGTLWAWGDNTSYQLGNGGNTSSTTIKTPVPIKEGTKFKEISLGCSNALAIDENGDIWQWGVIWRAGASYSVKEPEKIVSSVKFKKIAAGAYISLAIDEEGNLYSWGKNDDGELGNGTTEDELTPTQIKEGTKFKEIASGKAHLAPFSLAIDEEGNLYSWGVNKNGELGNGGTTTVTIPRRIKVGTKFEKISTGDYFSLAIDEEGNLYSWGYNSGGQLGNGTTTSIYTPTKVMLGTKFKEISAGIGNNRHSLVIDEEGNMWSCGINTDGALGDGTKTDTNIFIQITGPRTEYTVTFMNGTDTVKTETVIEGEAATAPELTKEGYTLSWDKEFNNITSDLTVNAVWTPNTDTAYKVEHYKQNTTLNGYELAETENKTGTTGAVAVAIAKTSYEGFTENTEYTQRVASGNVAGDGSLVLKLYYDRNIYNVTLNTNEGIINSGDVTTYTYGVGAILPTDITKEGYTFVGWYDNEELTGDAVTSIATTDMEDKNYYANWTINQYTVIFKDGENTQKTETVNYASSATAPELTKEGYTLTWDTDFSNVTSDLTVNAVWTANTNTPYKVEHYRRNLDNEVIGYDLFETEDLTGTTDTEVTAVAKTYEGFTENTEHEGRIASGNIAGDGSLILKLYYDRNSYNITYELNGGTASGELTNSYTYGKGLNLSNRVTKLGYEFAGWYDNEELTGDVITTITTTEIGDKTYYAKWTQNEFTVTFKDGENIIKTEVVNRGQAATAPELTKAGYTLSWDIDFSNVTSDLTVNAIWTANTNTPYKVEHYRRNLDNEVIGYDLFETEDLIGTTDTEVTAVAKTYEGFTENTEHEGRIASGNIAGDGSLVLKLYYDRNTYNITYELNEGETTGELTNSYTYGKELTLSNRVTKPGYVFVGWYDNANLEGSTITRINAGEIGNKTFYAKWTSQEQLYITSEKHSINTEKKQITKVSPNTNVETFINNLSTNGTVKILNLNGDEVALNGLVGTGYKVQINYKGTISEYEIAVRGDLDGNGKTTITDLSILNQVLVKKLTVTGIREKAADIDYSERTTITDLSMLNQAIVGKIKL